MQSWIIAHGGLMASVVLVVACFNVVMSAIKSLCDKLKVQEPVWLQKVGAAGSAVASWLSANTAAGLAAKQEEQKQEEKPAA